MSKCIIQINELVKRMYGYNYLSLNTGKYIPVPVIRFREDDLKDLVPAQGFNIPPEFGYNMYKYPTVEGKTSYWHQVPDIYFQKGAWYDLPIPYEIYEPAIHFREENLQDLIPTPHAFLKNLYRDAKTGTFYEIPEYYFHNHAFENLILIPNHSVDDSAIKVKFLEKTSKQHVKNELMIQEINRLFTLKDDQGYFGHEFSLLLDDYCLHEEWRAYAKEEEACAREKVKSIAIQWCEENGLEYSLGE